MQANNATALQPPRKVAYTRCPSTACTSAGEASAAYMITTVQDGARIGRRSLIGAGSLVAPGAEIPDDVMALGAPARVRGPLSEAAAGWVERALTHVRSLPPKVKKPKRARK